MLYNICCITSKQAWDQFYVTKFILYNKKSYAIYDISTFQMLIGSWRGFSGRTAGHNCWTLIISLASLAALLGSWCAAQSGQKKLKVWTCHGGLSCSGKSKWTAALALPWMAAIIKKYWIHIASNRQRGNSVCAPVWDTAV